MTQENPDVCEVHVIWEHLLQNLYSHFLKFKFFYYHLASLFSFCECFYGKFSVKTDVWAFGITLWEIFTLCKSLPFIGLTNQEVIEDAIKRANRRIPELPVICPDDIYTIMKKNCWQHKPSERATFRVLCDQLNDYYSNI